VTVEKVIQSTISETKAGSPPSLLRVKSDTEPFPIFSSKANTPDVKQELDSESVSMGGSTPRESERNTPDRRVDQGKAPRQNQTQTFLSWK